MARIFLSRYSLAVYSVVTTIAFLLVAVVPYVQVNWYQDKNHVAMAALPDPGLSPGCINVFDNDVYSLIYKPNSQWGTQFMMPSASNGSSSSTSPINQLIDLNGDGLPDYIYSSHNAGATIIQDCVYLNTGTGWQKAYVCKVYYVWVPQLGTNQYRYYGDCAA